MTMVVRGTLLQKWNTTTSLWETIAGIKGLNTGAENEQGDYTTIDQTARRRKPVIQNNGPWSGTLLWDDSLPMHNHLTGLEKARLDGTQAKYSILYTSGIREIAALASVQSLGKSLAVAGFIECSFQLAIDGEITYEG